MFGDLLRVVHGISQDGARELRRHGLTPAQYRLLLAVGATPGCRQHELGDLLGVTKGNVSMLVSRLERDGLVVVGGLVIGSIGLTLSLGFVYAVFTGIDTLI